MRIDFVKDNDPQGPEAIVISVAYTKRPSGIPELDGEPFTQIVHLSCGHFCYNTFGNRIKEKFIGQTMKCYLCGQKELKGR